MTEPKCNNATKYDLIAGASSYACVLDKGHDGDCQPGGTCFAHGPYVGLMNGLVQCPQWPKCVTDPQIYKPVEGEKVS